MYYISYILGVTSHDIAQVFSKQCKNTKQQVTAVVILDRHLQIPFHIHSSLQTKGILNQPFVGMKRKNLNNQ